LRRYRARAPAGTRAPPADEGRRSLGVVGVVTDRDIVVGAIARDCDPDVMTVGGIASVHALGVPANADLDEAVRRMQRAGVQRLMVHPAEDHVVGIGSFDDLLEACAALVSDVIELPRGGVERCVDADIPSDAVLSLRPATHVIDPEGECRRPLSCVPAVVLAASQT
jgi:CBS-domain-containing membrane protein